MSARTIDHRGTVLRTASFLFVLLLAAQVNARERALYLQLPDATEDALPGLLERMAASKPDGEVRVASSQAVAKLLERGHSDAVTDRALEALGAIGTNTAGQVLGQYAHHRRVAARARAFIALGRVAGSDRALRELVASGLRDSAPEVRGAAARSLETLKATEATPVLLKAVGRGVPEAAVTLGAIGDASSLESYHAYLRQQPLDVMLAGYERYVLRPDLSEKSKLDVIARLEDVSGPAVLRFTSALASRPQLSAALRQAASAATFRIAKAQAQATGAASAPAKPAVGATPQAGRASAAPAKPPTPKPDAASAAPAKPPTPATPKPNGASAAPAEPATPQPNGAKP
jgi:HEAT repeat protein